MNFRSTGTLLCAFALSLVVARGASGEDPVPQKDRVTQALLRLKEAYPDQKFEVDGQELVWPDGVRMKGDDGKGQKTAAQWLEDPDIEDMFQVPYPAGAPASPPAVDSDPGRARPAQLFEKMYGNCQKGGVLPHLKRITWLRKKAPQSIEVTTVNGVADKLQAVSDELDGLSSSFDKFLIPAAGAYNCRVIAGTDRMSAHGAGIAIDIATKHSSYWRWGKGGEKDPIAFKNEIPLEIVKIFEKHGFIWGGRWYHYDTMHFEYRPELMPSLSSQQ